MRARNARLALATVLAEGFLGRLTFGMVSFAMPLYAHKIGLPLSLIGILVSIRTLCVLPLKPVAGWLADRIGVRRVYLLGIFARTLSAAMLLLWAADRLLHPPVRPGGQPTHSRASSRQRLWRSRQCPPRRRGRQRAG